MKTEKMIRLLLCSGLLCSLPALAQQGRVMPPPAIQAIDTHLQQTRTREQRDAIENKSSAPVEQTQPPNYQTGGIKKNLGTSKPKSPQATKQNFDDQTRLDRTEQLRANSLPARNPGK